MSELRDLVAQTIFDANEQSTSRVMDRRNVMAWDDAPDPYKGVLMEIADAFLGRFDVRLRVPQANEDWDVSIVGRVVAGDFERACDHLMLALVELGGTDPGISGNLSTGEVEIDWLWHEPREESGVDPDARR